MLSIRLIGQEQLVAKLQAMPAGVRRELRTEVRKQTLGLEAYIKTSKLSGQVLNVRSGDLRASIHSTFQETATSEIGKVSSSGDVKYAAIHEFGGKTAAHDIVPTKGKALAFLFGGSMSFFKRVHHPGSSIPERSYMRSALADKRAQIVAGIREAARRGVLHP